MGKTKKRARTADNGVVRSQPVNMVDATATGPAIDPEPTTFVYTKAECFADKVLEYLKPAFEDRPVRELYVRNMEGTEKIKAKKEANRSDDAILAMQRIAVENELAGFNPLGDMSGYFDTSRSLYRVSMFAELDSRTESTVVPHRACRQVSNGGLDWAMLNGVAHIKNATMTERNYITGQLNYSHGEGDPAITGTNHCVHTMNYNQIADVLRPLLIGFFDNVSDERIIIMDEYVSKFCLSSIVEKTLTEGLVPARDLLSEIPADDDEDNTDNTADESVIHDPIELILELLDKDKEHLELTELRILVIALLAQDYLNTECYYERTATNPDIAKPVLFVKVSSIMESCYYPDKICMIDDDAFEYVIMTAYTALYNTTLLNNIDVPRQVKVYQMLRSAQALDEVLSNVIYSEDDVYIAKYPVLEILARARAAVLAEYGYLTRPTVSHLVIATGTSSYIDSPNQALYGLLVWGNVINLIETEGDSITTRVYTDLLFRRFSEIQCGPFPPHLHRTDCLDLYPTIDTIWALVINTIQSKCRSMFRKTGVWRLKYRGADADYHWATNITEYIPCLEKLLQATEQPIVLPVALLDAIEPFDSKNGDRVTNSIREKQQTSIFYQEPVFDPEVNVMIAMMNQRGTIRYLSTMIERFVSTCTRVCSSITTTQPNGYIYRMLVRMSLQYHHPVSIREIRKLLSKFAKVPYFRMVYILYLFDSIPFDGNNIQFFRGLWDITPEEILHLDLGKDRDGILKDIAAYAKQ